MSDSPMCASQAFTVACNCVRLVPSGVKSHSDVQRRHCSVLFVLTLECHGVGIQGKDEQCSWTPGRPRRRGY